LRFLVQQGPIRPEQHRVQHDRIPVPRIRRTSLSNLPDRRIGSAPRRGRKTTAETLESSPSERPPAAVRVLAKSGPAEGIMGCSRRSSADDREGLLEGWLGMLGQYLANCGRFVLFKRRLAMAPGSGSPWAPSDGAVIFEDRQTIPVPFSAAKIPVDYTCDWRQFLCRLFALDTGGLFG